MKYPKEVAKKISILDKYEWDESLSSFNIIHMYPGKLCYPNGYYDARWFECVVFNTETMKKRDIGRHDALRFYDNAPVDALQVYADGAFLCKLKIFAKVPAWSGNDVWFE